MDIQALESALAGSPMFRDLDPESRVELAGVGVQRSLAAGASLYQRGAISDGTFCLVLSGTFEVLSETGAVVNRKEPGDVIGEIAILGRQQKRSATVRAVEPAELCEWRYYTLEPRHPNLSRRLRELAWEHARNYS